MELITAIRPVVERVAPRDKDLAGQMRRAATSAAANTAEGGRRSGGDRLHAFRIASAEAAEAVTHARIAAAWGHVDAADLAEVLALADRLQAVLWRLRQSRRSRRRAARAPWWRARETPLRHALAVARAAQGDRGNGSALVA